MPRNEIQCAEDACRIRDRMGRIRNQMDREVQGIKKGAGNLLSIHHQVRSHPWMGIGAAALIGFFIVPARKKRQEIQLDEQTVQKLIERGDIRVEAHRKQKKSWVRSATTLATNAALRAALAYAGQQFGKVSSVMAADNRPSANEVEVN
ncbi:hypothetical protein Mal48_45840 [Thalassoglobus polymorphus]|uniref:Uncharacterized protein n=2 Tax=Thalassoglobus polymorphus TaxID=2527994 RepID=A0A517QUK8_9PLAN|nr:hypothetical protein Mal48_45840 [Thalassoglobus polymorphus]